MNRLAKRKVVFSWNFPLFTGFAHLEEQDRRKTDAVIQWNHLKLQTVVEEKTTRDKTSCNTLYMFRWWFDNQVLKISLFYLTTSSS